MGCTGVNEEYETKRLRSQFLSVCCVVQNQLKCI